MRQRLLGALVSACAVAAAATLDAAESWTEVRSPSFVVATDGSEKDARRVALQFERMRAFLGHQWPWARLDPQRPVTILAVRDENGMRALAPEFWEKPGVARPAGLFVGTPWRNWILVRLDAGRAARDAGLRDSPYRVVFHEYVHLVLGANFKSVPLWFGEGVADYWGSTVIEDDHVDVGQPIESHILLLRRSAGLPLARLFAATRASADYSRHEAAPLFYAQSWALVHYLALGAEARAGQLNRLGEALRDGRAAPVAIGEILGDAAALERELRDYVGGTRFRYRRKLVRSGIDDASFARRGLPPAESLALRGGFHAAMRRSREARALAAQALALDPGAALAHETLAFLAVLAGDWKDARHEGTLASSAPGASDYAHYVTGVATLTEAGQDGTAEAEVALRRALEINPSYADALTTLALLKARRKDPIETTLPLAVKAATLEPSGIRYTLNALIVTALGGRGDEALAAARSLRDGLPDGEDRRQVELLVRQLEVRAGSSREPSDASGPANRSAARDAERTFAEERARAEAAFSCPTPEVAPGAVSAADVRRLTADLRQGEVGARLAAASRLGGVRPPTRAVVEALADALQHPDDAVRHAVAAALDALGCAAGYDEVARDLSRPPRPIRIERPRYPQRASMEKVEGTVLVELLIDRRGDVRSARVLQSVAGLDEAAVECARRWAFAPALKAGRVVATVAQAPIGFKAR